MLSHAPLFRFKAGDHACVFYRDTNHMLEFLASYIAEGLRNGERCFCVQSAEIMEQLKASLSFLGINVVAELRRGSLKLHTEKEVYYPGGSFTPASMLELLKAGIAGARDEGFTGLRTAGEMGWAATGECDCDRLIEYEEMVNQAFPGQPVIGICQYDMRRFEESVLERILEQHTSMLSRTGNTLTFTIRRQRYLADIVADRNAPQSKFYYVAQQRHSREVLGWGSEPTFDQAVMEAESLLGQLARTSTKHKTRGLSSLH